MIDAAVNGGVAKYQEAFFSAEFLRENPDHADDVAKLQRLMLEQVRILAHALSHHERLISPGKRCCLMFSLKIMPSLNGQFRQYQC